MELLCIQTHSKGIVKAGLTYNAINKRICSCGMAQYDVGIKYPHKNYLCNKCGLISNGGEIAWMSSRLFAQIGTKDENECYSEKQLIENG